MTNQFRLRIKLLPMIVVGLFCSCATPSASVAPTSSDPEKELNLLLQAASASLIEQNLSNAFKYLKQAEALNPKKPEIYHIRAVAYHTKKDYSQALYEMKKAITLNPNDPNANNTYGKMLLDANQFGPAEEALKKATLDPSFNELFKARTNLGMLYYRQSQFDKAAEQFQKATLDDPSNACIANYYLGHLNLRKALFDEATLHYKHASQKLCAGFAEAHLALAIVYERTKQVDLARKKLIEIHQNFAGSSVAKQAVDRLNQLTQ